MAISLIDSDKLSASLGAVTVLFADLMGSMAIFSKISGDMKGVTKTCAAMLAVSTSVLILASALKKIADLDAGQLAVGLTGIAGMMAALVASMKVLGSGSGSVVKGATQMIIFAGAIKILASVCTDLADLEWGQLAKGLTGVGVLLAEVSLFLNTAKFSGKSITTATGIVILSGAIKVLASACKDFGQMNWGEIAKGLTSIGALLLEVSAFTKLTGNAKHVISTGLALIEIAAAMKIFASAMKSFSSMSWEEIGRGLTAMGGALAEVTLAMNLMPKNMVGIGVGLIAVGAALEIVADSLRKMGGMSWEEIAKGLVTLGGALAELAIGLNLMNGTLAGSAAMLVAAGALAVLTPVLVVLGSMSWESIAKGLVTLAGAFTVIGVAGAVLTPLVPTILGLAGAFALIGVGTLGIGAGLLAIGAGLSAIAIGITALATSMGAGVAIIVAGLTTIITGIAALIPAIAEKLGEAVVAFCKVISDGAPAIGEAVKALVLTLVDVLVECVPALANGALELIAGVLSALVTYTPQIVDSIAQFLVEVIEGIARNLPDLIQAAVHLLMAFFSGIVDALA
ncbi:phage tail tape measure protein, partial [Oscillospiraceae bacterium 44-34]